MERLPIKHPISVLSIALIILVLIPVGIISLTNHRLYPHISFDLIVSLLLIFTGLYLFFTCVLLFYKKRASSIAPRSAKTKFLLEGPYRYIRNPMSTGVLLILLGTALWFQSIWILLELLIFFVVNTIYFKLLKEADLLKRFGEFYGEYVKRVPMWLPILNHTLLWRNRI